MTRFAYALLVGIVGAGIVHIAVLFLLPHFAERDAWSQLAERSGLYEPARIEHGDNITLDPLFEAMACRFDLAEGPVRVSAPGGVPFWSISIYDRAGRNIFSLNERTAANGELDIVVITPLQMLELRQAFPSLFERSIFVETDMEEGMALVRGFVETDMEEGMALVRGFVPDATWEPRVTAYLESIACTPH